MGKSQKAAPVKSGAHEPRAGKKHRFTEPEKPNVDKRDARLAGEQQFVRNKGRKVGSIVAPKSLTEQVFDVLTRAFEVNRIPRKPFDTGYRWDEKRKRVVVPEGEFSNGF